MGSLLALLSKLLGSSCLTHVGREGTTGPFWRFQLTNLIDSAVMELDPQGHVISYEEYHPFGSTAFRSSDSSSEVSPKRYRFTGKERDEETGLYYYGARYYMAWLGRWTAADPAGFADGPNLYGYARDNPVRLNDPQGTQSTEQQQTQPSEADIRSYRNTVLKGQNPFNAGVSLDVLEAVRQRYGGISGTQIIQHSIGEFQQGGAESIAGTIQGFRALASSQGRQAVALGIIHFAQDKDSLVPIAKKAKAFGKKIVSGDPRAIGHATGELVQILVPLTKAGAAGKLARLANLGDHPKPAIHDHPKTGHMK